MSETRSHKRKPPADPAVDANKRILEERQARIDDKKAVETLATDLGLDLKDPEPDPGRPTDNVAQFLDEEWDKKTFGDSIPTYTRTVYGPDNLLISCPEMKASIENVGLEDYANATAEAILLREEKAVPDPVLQKGLRAAIARFGKDAVATAFRDRILRIPRRTVEVEADRSDAMIFAKPLEEAVMKYGSPGMAPKFLSESCIGRLGLRGYVIVKDERGDPVKVGTLIMGEIPIRMAEARRQYWANESDQQIQETVEQFEDTAARAIRDKAGFSVLRPGEQVSSSAAGDFVNDPVLTNSYLGRSRDTGFRVERER
jgi:hypothetical protein